jgi:flagellar basal body-associated protein FliL
MMVVIVVVVIVMVVIVVVMIVVVMMIVVMLLSGWGLGLRRLRFSADRRCRHHPCSCYSHDQDFLQHSDSPIWARNLHALVLNSFSNERALNETP